MLKVFRITDDEYFVSTQRESLPGNLVRTVENLSSLGIELEEIQNGLVSLQLNDHNVAEYGIYGSFIYSDRLGIRP